MEDDLGRRGCEVDPEGERARVDLAWPPAVVPHVVHEVGRALGQAHAAGLEGPLEDGGVEHGDVGRGGGGQQEVDGEAGFAQGELVDLGGGDQAAGGPAHRQVSQPRAVERRVLTPRGVGEPPVPGVDLDRRLDVGAEPTRQCQARHRSQVPGQLQAGLRHSQGAAHQAAPHLRERSAELRDVPVLEEAGLGCQDGGRLVADVVGGLRAHRNCSRTAPR